MSRQSLVPLSACPTDRLAIGAFLAGMGIGGGTKRPGSRCLLGSGGSARSAQVGELTAVIGLPAGTLTRPGRRPATNSAPGYLTAGGEPSCYLAE